LFADLNPTEEQRRVLQTGLQAALATCMEQRGFAYTPVLPTSDVDETDGLPGNLLPGDIDGASARGYGLADRVEASASPPLPDVNQVRFDKMRPDQRRRWEEALRGPPLPPMDSVDAVDDSDVMTIAVPLGPVIRWNRTSCMASARRAV